MARKLTKKTVDPLKDLSATMQTPAPKPLVSEPLKSSLPRELLPVTESAPLIDGAFDTVRSNIKGGVNLTLSSCTAIVSERNRVGGTAVLDTFRLGVTGKHPIGENNLLRLTDGKTLMVELKGANLFTRVSVPEGKKQPEIEFEGAFKPCEAALPQLGILDLLKGGTAARAAFFTRFGKLDKIAEPKGLKTEEALVWNGTDAIIKLKAKQHDAVAALSDLPSELRRYFLAANVDVRRADADVAELLKAVQAPVTAEQIAEAEAVVTAAQLWAKTATGRARMDVLPKEYDALEAVKQPKHHIAADGKAYKYNLGEHLKRTAVIMELQAQIAALEPVVKELAEPLDDLEVIQRFRTLMPQFEGTCLACEVAHPAKNVKRLIEEGTQACNEARKALGEKRNELAQLKLKVRELEVEDTKTTQTEAKALDNAELAFQNYTRTEERLQNEYVALEAQLAEVAPADPGVTEAEAKIRLNALREVKKVSDKLEEAQALKGTRGRDADTYRRLEQEALSLLQRSMLSAREAAETAVNKYMPAGFKATVTLADANGNAEYTWEVVGADGQPHTRFAMSGSELGSLMIALALAWTEDQKYRFLLLDDTDLAVFDRENLRIFLGKVRELVTSGLITQAIVVWKRPDEIPTDWPTVLL